MLPITAAKATTMGRESDAAKMVAPRAVAMGIDPEHLLDFEAARRRPFVQRMRWAFIGPASPCSTTRRTERSTPPKITDDGATSTWRAGSAMEAIRLSELERLRDALARHEVEYLFLGKTGAILQG